MVGTLVQKIIPGKALISPVGMDISPTAIRAAQLECRDKCHWIIKRMTTVKRREAETGTTTSDGFSSRLKDTLHQSGFQGYRVVAGLATPEIELHSLELEVHGASEDKFANAVRWELERVMASEDVDVVTHYWKVPPTKMSRITAVGVVAPKIQVRTATDIVHGMGMDCERIDATVCSLSRLGTVIRSCRGDEPNGIWGVLDVGQRALRLVLCAGEVPLLVRTLGSGCNSWSQAIAESLGVSPEAAEVHKCEYGIDTTQPDPDSESPEQKVGAMIFDVLRAELDLVVSEVERSYGYAMHCYPDRSAGGMFLVGGGAHMNGLADYLSSKLGVDVESMSGNVRGSGGSFSIESGDDAEFCQHAAAVGLAIEVNDK